MIGEEPGRAAPGSSIMPVAVHMSVAVQATPTLAQLTLGALRNHRRVLVAFAPTADDPRLLTQRRAAAELTGEADDRDITFVVVAGSAVRGLADSASALRSRLRVRPEEFRVVLVGKDGHAALSEPEPVAAEVLRRRIDGMPMRRQEMRWR